MLCNDIIYIHLFQELWFIQGKKGRPASGYLEDRLRYIRKKMYKENRANSQNTGGCQDKKAKEEKDEPPACPGTYLASSHTCCGQDDLIFVSKLYRAC